MHPAIAVFTERTADDIIAAGGSGAWVLNPKNAKTHRYIVCCRKSGAVDSTHGGEHGAAFLVGLVKALIEVGENDRRQKRYHVSISEYALIERPDVWKAWRNPVKYTSLEELGIAPGELKFVPAPPPTERSKAEWQAEIPRRAPGRLSITDAKQGLAETFGVSIDDIEIVIRS